MRAILLVVVVAGCGGGGGGASDGGGDGDGDLADGAFDSAPKADAAPIPLSCGSATRVHMTSRVIEDIEVDASEAYWIESNRAGDVRVWRQKVPGGAPQEAVASTAIHEIALDPSYLYWTSDSAIHRWARDVAGDVVMWQSAPALRPLAPASDGSNLYFGAGSVFGFVPAGVAGPTAQTEVCHSALGPLGALQLEVTAATLVSGSSIVSTPLSARGAACASAPAGVLPDRLVLTSSDVLLSARAPSGQAGVYAVPRGGGSARPLYPTTSAAARALVRVGRSRIYWVQDGPTEQIMEGASDGNLSLRAVWTGTLPVTTLAAGVDVLYFSVYDAAGGTGILCRYVPQGSP